MHRIELFIGYTWFYARRGLTIFQTCDLSMSSLKAQQGFTFTCTALRIVRLSESFQPCRISRNQRLAAFYKAFLGSAEGCSLGFMRHIAGFPCELAWAPRTPILRLGPEHHDDG